MADTIRFYTVKGPYGWCSNFASSPIELDGRTWPTVEHWFQSQKFSGTEHEEAIRTASSPTIAARMGRSRKRPLRSDWEEVKDDVMHVGLRAKFTQHEALRGLLVATGDATLVEHTDNDHYWADGGDGSGKNRLGELLMAVRDELREAQGHVAAYAAIMKPGRAWVVFLLGTCVVVDESEPDPAARAKEILREHGSVHVGTPAGDFNPHRMSDDFGWLIGFDHPNIMARVPIGEAGDPGELTAGLIGRRARHEDARVLGVVHVEQH